MRSFESMMQLAVDKAANMGRSCYVILANGKLECDFHWIRGWLFRAYPGGRKVLSVEGKEFADRTKVVAFYKH